MMQSKSKLSEDERKISDNSNLEFMNLLRNRYSVRKFSSQQVEDEKINMILEAGRLAPTACNLQPFKVYVLKSKEALETLQKCKLSHYGETLAFIVCCDKEKCWNREYDHKLSGEIDATIVTTHMMLAITSLGLGSTWIMNFVLEALIHEFNFPSNLEPISILVVGYPAVDSGPSPRHYERKQISDLVESL